MHLAEYRIQDYYVQISEKAEFIMYSHIKEKDLETLGEAGSVMMDRSAYTIDISTWTRRKGFTIRT